MNQKPRYRTLPSEAPIWVNEPFRVFFPLGVSASILGVLLWPLFYAEIWPFPPQLQHPRIMIYGFGFAFVAGFLGTAWPRFLEAEALRRSELLLLVLSWLLTQVFCAVHRLQAADLSFAAHALLLIAILGIRFKRGGALPPPGFALAFCSVFLSFCFALAWGLAPAGLPPQLQIFTRLFLWQGMLLLPLMGVGSYLFARFFQVEGQRPPSAPAARRSLGVWLGAFLVLVSFAVESGFGIRAGNLLRFGAMLIWAFFAAPAIWRGPAPSTRAWGLRIALGSIAASFLIRGIWPGPAYALEHLFFLAGVGLAMLLVADRVSVGHGGDPESLPAKSRLWRWLVWLILLAAATRISADMKASLVISHQIYAALLWALLVAIWAKFHAPFWRQRGKD